MLDLYGIVFTSVMMLVVIIRAFQIDRVRPWFQTITIETPGPAGPAKPPWKRRR